MENSMNKIRHKVFETNSSSTHSISIDTNNIGLMEILFPDDEGNIVLNGGEFGWCHETFYAAVDKASYMAIYAQEWGGPNKDQFIETLKNVIKVQTGAKDVIFNFTDESSYIDHQSVENHDYDYLFEDERLLRLFIFSKNSFLRTGNDNS